MDQDTNFARFMTPSLKEDTCQIRVDGQIRLQYVYARVDVDISEFGKKNIGIRVDVALE